MVFKHGFAKYLPFAFSSACMRAVQTLTRTGQLFGHRSMHVDPEALAESPHTRAVMRPVTHTVSPSEDTSMQ
ncbi:hypothetical protein [Paraburkholderia ferrariae]|uniref:Uncharacterized protein n=1 Tax=Paraburkholderia ferrariae TaxID=386056 RepID=A0ABU9S330_9BURK